MYLFDVGLMSVVIRFRVCEIIGGSWIRFDVCCVFGMVVVIWVICGECVVLLCFV